MKSLDRDRIIAVQMGHALTDGEGGSWSLDLVDATELADALEPLIDAMGPSMITDEALEAAASALDEAGYGTRGSDELRTAIEAANSRRNKP